MKKLALLLVLGASLGTNAFLLYTGPGPRALPATAASGGQFSPSDAKFKERVGVISPADGSVGALAKLLQLRPRQYHFKATPEYARVGLPEGKQFGFIAQEVEAVLPELVRDELVPSEPVFDQNGRKVSDTAPIAYKSVNYVQMIPLLVQALQEQQAEIEKLKAKAGQ